MLDFWIDFHNVKSAGHATGQLSGTTHHIWLLWGSTSKIYSGIGIFKKNFDFFFDKRIEEVHFYEAKQMFGLRQHEFKQFKCSVSLLFNTSDMNKSWSWIWLAVWCVKDKPTCWSSGGAERSRDWLNVRSQSDIILAGWQTSTMVLIKAASMDRFLISPSTWTSGLLCCTYACPLDRAREFLYTLASTFWIKPHQWLNE